MEENKKINVHVTGVDQEKPIVLVIREGEAEPIKDLVQVINETVTIDSITEFVAKRNWATTAKEEKALLQFSIDPEKPFIILQVDPENIEGTVLESYLTPNPDLKAFGINSGKTFTPKALCDLLRKYSHVLKDGPAFAKSLIDSCRNFEAKFETELKKEDDRRGGTTDNVKRSLQFAKGELPKLLQLNAPLFKSTPPVGLTLEIEVDAQNNQPVYTFYCMEYDALMKDKAAEYILAVVEPLRSKFICLEK